MAWLRERRYEAYVGAYALIKSFDLNRYKTLKIAARGRRLSRSGSLPTAMR